MLSSLPKLADRAFILGAFLPTLLFTVALLFLFQDQPLAKALVEAMTTKDYGVAVFLLLAVWAVAVLLLILNHPLYRFLEGYPPFFPRWLAEWFAKLNQQHLQDRSDEIRKLYEKYALERERFTELDRYQTLRFKLVNQMPSMVGDVLPTRFGNAIRAFEVYPRDIYGADGVAIWLRLASVMPKQFADQIQDTRSQIDFLINCCLFSSIIALVGLGRIICSPSWIWLFWTAGGAVATYVFYRWAVTCVPAWGNLVMSAFDCYLPELAGQLGFELPTTEAKRLRFWKTFSLQLIYRREPNGETPFRIEEWKKAQSKGVNKKLECGTKTRDGKGQDSGNNNDSED